MCMLESLLYCLAGLLLIAIIHNNHFPPLFYILLAVILAPSLVCVAVLAYKILAVLGVVGKLKSACASKRQTSECDNEPDRLTHPTEYSALLP